MAIVLANRTLAEKFIRHENDAQSIQANDFSSIFEQKFLGFNDNFQHFSRKTTKCSNFNYHFAAISKPKRREGEEDEQAANGGKALSGERERRNEREIWKR